MKKENNRAEIELLIHQIAILSGQLMESVQFEFEEINLDKCEQSTLALENQIQELKKLLGKGGATANK